MARGRSIRLVLLASGLGVLCVATPTASAVPPTAVVEPELSRSGRVVTSTEGGFLPPTERHAYQWYRCSGASTSTCSRVTGATGKSYVLRTADIDMYVRSKVTGSNADGSDTTGYSNAVGLIRAAPPKNTATPRVTGSPGRGVTLATTTGTWSGRLAGDPAFTYQWQRCTTRSLGSCTSVAGARGARYTLAAADVGRYIRVLVGAEGLGRARIGAPGTPIGPVQNPPATLQRLSPFPVLVIAGRLRGRTTRISDFVVRGPRRAKVSVRCRGKRCPFRRIGGTIGPRKRLRFRRAQRRYRAGQVLEVRVTGRNRIGKFTRIAFRRRLAPRRSDLCLRPGTTKPTSCSGL